MSIQTALDEYNLALKQGQREYRELVMEGRSPYPAVLDDILPDAFAVCREAAWRTIGQKP